MTDLHTVAARRAAWIAQLTRLVEPVFAAGARGSLRADLDAHCDRGLGPTRACEAIARSLTGAAPWLAGEGGDTEEQAHRSRLRDLAIATLNRALRPGGDVHEALGRVDEHWQAIVESAFLAHGFLRAPSLLDALDPEAVDHFHAALRNLHACRVPINNWLLFTAIVETYRMARGQPFDAVRIQAGLEMHEDWYLGDGVYGDGRRFRMDYYNGYVIHPMLIDIVDHLAERDWPVPQRDAAAERFARYAEIQELMISPDGTWPPLGRSICYRCGAFQPLAQAALQHRYTDALTPAQVRGALFAAIDRSLSAPGAYDADGYLTPGLAGEQKGLAEIYITRGSVYLASAAFLPLGLPPEDPFWSDADTPWRQQRIWAGDPTVRMDAALHD